MGAERNTDRTGVVINPACAGFDTVEAATRIVPPTINFKTPDPECDIDCVPNAARALPVRTAITNAFGFGGQNCVAVLTAPG